MHTSGNSANTDEIRCPLPFQSKVAAKRSPAMTTCVLGMLAFGVSWHGAQPKCRGMSWVLVHEERFGQACPYMCVCVHVSTILYPLV